MLSPVSLYGVRLYHNNSILAPHVDRMPLVTSCISKFWNAVHIAVDVLEYILIYMLYCPLILLRLVQ